MNKRRAVFARWLAVTAACFAAAWMMCLLLPPMFDPWQQEAADSLFRLRYSLRGRQSIYPLIAQLVIDDRSLIELGTTGDDREVHARLLTALRQTGVKYAIYDILFASKSEPLAEKAFVAAVREMRRVYFPLALAPLASVETPGLALELPPGTVWNPEVRGKDRLPAMRVAYGTSAGLAEAASGLGHINCFPEKDGMYRRLPLLLSVEDGYIPSLALRVACDYLSISPDKVRVISGRAVILPHASFPDGRVQDVRIPIDIQGRMFINYVGPWHDSFRQYSLADVLEATANESSFAELRNDLLDALVVICDASTTGKDFGAIPLEDYYPLSGIHANVLSSIFRQDFLRRLPLAGEVFLNLALAIALVLLAAYFRGVPFIALALAVLGLFAAFSILAFSWGQILLNYIGPSLGLALSVVALVFLRYLQEEKEKGRLRARLEDYFEPALLDKILRSPERLAGCEKKELTILFSDIVGFSTWCATQSPEAIRRTLNEYFEAMVAIVFEHGGTIDKYIGDGMLAFFGDPTEYPDHARRAVAAAVQMQHESRELRRRWRKTGGLPLRIRIGIHTGEVVVGNMGSERRVDYTVIGSNVNLAQRLESRAPQGGILMSRSVSDALDDSVKAGPRYKLKVKGFSKSVEVCEVKLAQR